MGERLLCKQDVVGSIPSVSTKFWSVAFRAEDFCFRQGRQASDKGVYKEVHDRRPKRSLTQPKTKRRKRTGGESARLMEREVDSSSLFGKPEGVDTSSGFTLHIGHVPFVRSLM